MSTNATSVLSKLLSELTGVHVAAERLGMTLGKVKTAAVAAGAVFVGWEIGKGLWAATKHAEALNHELIKLKIGAGLNDAQTKEAEVMAFQTSRDVKGTSSHENIKMKRELFGVFSDMGEASRLTPIVALGSQVVRNFTDKTGVDLAQVAMKTLELRGHMTKDGKVDEEEFKHEFSAMVRSIVASEGLVDPAKLYMATKQAGPAARAMNSDEFWGKFPAIINALGAGPSGTAMMSLFSQLVGHVIAGKRVAIAEERAGMLTHGKWRVGKGGKVEMDQDATPDQAGFMDHPLTWIHDKIEKMKGQKDAHGKPIDQVGIIQEIFQLSSRATSARLISDIYANWPVIQAEEARFKRMPSPEAMKKEQDDKDLSINIHNLTEAWNNFLTALGGPGIPVAISVMHGMTDALNYLQRLIVEHPEAAKDLFYLAGGISAMTVLGGGITLFMVAWSPFVFGVKMLIGTASGVATAATGLVSLAGGLRAIGLFFTGPIGAALMALSIMKPSATNVGEENTPGYADRFGKKDPNVLPLPPKGNDGTGKRSGDVYLDGKKVGMIIMDHTANSLSRAPTGRSGADMRISPMMPGMSTAFG